MKNNSFIVYILTITLLLILFICVYKKKCSNNLEKYDNQNMGSIKFWGWGKESGYSQYDHYQDRYFCYPVSQRDGVYPWWLPEENRTCLPGYHGSTDPITKRAECCVNISNYSS